MYFQRIHSHTLADEENKAFVSHRNTKCGKPPAIGQILSALVSRSVSTQVSWSLQFDCLLDRLGAGLPDRLVRLSPGPCSLSVSWSVKCTGDQCTPSRCTIRRSQGRAPTARCSPIAKGALGECRRTMQPATEADPGVVTVQWRNQGGTYTGPFWIFPELKH